VSDDAGSIAYLPDHITSVGVSNEVRDLIHDTDVLLHDAQFVEKERALSDAYGHSTVDDAVALAQECGARRLVAFHHGPARTDDALDTLVEMYADRPWISFAKQGDDIHVGRPA
jgi:ribonuclease BN (tRNA processing enzyme)